MNGMLAGAFPTNGMLTSGISDERHLLTEGISDERYVLAKDAFPMSGVLAEASFRLSKRSDFEPQAAHCDELPPCHL